MTRTTTRTTFAERALVMQGFDRRADRRAARWLRLTPSLSTLWIGSGTALAAPRVLLGFALVSAVGALGKRHPFDYLYDRGIRRWVRGARLPINPAPRRFAMGLAAVWAAAALFLTGRRRSGRVAGGLLAAAGATVASTHFCLGAWTYRQIARTR